MLGAAFLHIGIIHIAINMYVFEREVSHFAAVENGVVERFNDLQQGYDADEIERAEYLTAPGEELLPPWRNSRKRMGATDVRGLPDPLPERWEALLRYARLREEAFVLVIDAVETQDRARLALFADRPREADAALAALEALLD